MACSKPFIRVFPSKYFGQKIYIPLPCGHCAACRRDRINAWVDRLSFEALGKPSTFLTLTYDDEHLPPDKSVSYDDWKKFHDRLRHYKGVPKYKYFVTSEYGEVNYRPHMHVCLIGFDWRKPHLYDSIFRAWNNKGFFSCSCLNPARIRYTLKYMHKELVGSYQNDYEKLGLKPLFHCMSKGIGRKFFFENIDEIRKHNGYFVKGKLRPLPRYYADLLRLRDGETQKDRIHRMLTYAEKFQPVVDKRFSDYYNIFNAPMFPDSVISDTAREHHLLRQEAIDYSDALF